MADESARPGKASATILDRLVDILLIQILRQWTRTNAFTQSSWLRGMTDPAVEAALTAMHDDPARNWTLEDLASFAFSRAFTRAFGKPPRRYREAFRASAALES
jgi:transcriptional regulator GlxA family with amidase domain